MAAPMAYGSEAMGPSWHMPGASAPAAYPGTVAPAAGYAQLLGMGYGPMGAPVSMGGYAAPG